MHLQRSLSAVLIQADGTRQNLGTLDSREIHYTRGFPYRIAAVALAGVAALADPLGIVAGLVTTAGVTFLASDFVAGASAHISGFNYHDSGSGFAAEAVSDVALGTPTGVARVAGTQSSPSAGIYRTIGTITYDDTYTITEWGLFSLAAGGVLWDRAVFTAVPVVSGDGIEFTYVLTVVAGG
jgi:hypothetical protein